MKVSHFYELIIIHFHLQMMPTISLTALSAVIQEVVSVTISTKWHSNVIIVYNITIQWLNNYIHYYLLTHFITMITVTLRSTYVSKG